MSSASPQDREGAGVWEKAPETRSPWIVPVGPESRGGAEVNAPRVMEKRQARLGGAGAARVGGATTGPWRTPRAAGLMEGTGCRRRGGLGWPGLPTGRGWALWFMRA